jgi:hypothetical protein
MDTLLPSGNIFRELQDIHDTGYFSAQPSLEDHWQQVRGRVFGQLHFTGSSSVARGENDSTTDGIFIAAPYPSPVSPLSRAILREKIRRSASASFCTLRVQKPISGVFRLPCAYAAIVTRRVFLFIIVSLSSGLPSMTVLPILSITRL